MLHGSICGTCNGGILQDKLFVGHLYPFQVGILPTRETDVEDVTSNERERGRNVPSVCFRFIRKSVHTSTINIYIHQLQT